MSNSQKRRLNSDSSEVPLKVVKSEEKSEALPKSEPTNESAKPLNFDKPLNLKIFRTNLKNHFSITDVQHFVHVASKDASYITRYIDAGGQVLELVELLTRIDKTHSNAISTIFSAIHLSLMVISSSDAKLIEATTQSCRYLLKSYRHYFELLIRSADPNHNETAMKLMSSLVTMNVELAKTLLPVFDSIADDELKKFTRHVRIKSESSVDVNQETLRECFIHFVLSYIVEGNAMLIRRILEKSKILESIFEGLINDGHETVVWFINSMTKYVLKNSMVSKTEKFHLFNVNLIVEITKLYNWVGPNYVKKISSDNSAEIKSVAECIDHFLKTLLTSVKHGIAVPALLKSHGKTNSVQKRVLMLIHQQWNHEYIGNLIISVLQACPELVEAFMLKTANLFGNSIVFLSKLIQSLGPRNFAYCKNEMRFVDLKSILISICFSTTVFDQVMKLIESKDDDLILKAKQLLLCMFVQYESYYNAIVEWNVFKEHDLLHLRLDVLRKITTSCPTIDTMVASLFQIKTSFEAHFEVTLDLLQNIHNLFPVFIEKTSSTINYVQILKPILSSSKNHDTRLELKIIKFMLNLEPESLSPSAEFFDEVFESFVRISVEGNEEDQLEVTNSLRKILTITGLFDNGLPEIDIWLMALKYFPKHLDEISQFLIQTIKSMKSTSENVPAVQEAVVLKNADKQSTKSIEEMFHNIDNNISVQGLMEVPNLSGIFIYSIQNCNQTTQLTVHDYLKRIGLYLYFYLPSNEGIKSLTKIHHKSFNADAEKDTIIKIYYTINKFLVQCVDDKIPEIIDLIKSLNAESRTQILRYIYCQHFKILQQFNASECSTTNLLLELTKTFDVDMDLTRYYRSKIVNQISITADLETLTKTLENFRMSDVNCIEILRQANVPDAVVTFCLKRLNALRQSYLLPEDVRNLSAQYNENVEEGLLEYLQAFPHSVQYIDENFFKTIFNPEKFTKATTKLLCFLLERHIQYDAAAIELIQANVSHKELVYPILGVALRKKLQFAPKTLTAIYSEFKSGIAKSIEKPSKAGTIYRENVNTSIELINLCMMANECLDFCNKTIKFDTTELWQTVLVRAIHLKTIKSYKNDFESAKLAFVNFISMWIQMMNIYMKKEAVVSQGPKISTMIVIVFNWINDLKIYFENQNLSFSKITTSQYWLQFCWNCLKFGMADETASDCDGSSKLLKIMAFLCDAFYSDVDKNNDPATFFEMTLSHSQFFDIILSKETNTAAKSNLVFLLYVLTKKNSSVLDSKHIPVLLGAYNATLSITDQYLLALIQFYELHGISLYEFRPFLWGESAVTHYSLREEYNENLVISEPSMYVVQSLFHNDICENSIQNYPIWRTLDTKNQVPAINFDECACDIEDEYRPGKFYSTLNTIEQIVEKGSRFFNRSTLKIAPFKATTYHNVYDPAFVVPLMGQIFSPESYSNPSITACNGSLGILVVALSSPDVNLRLAAGNSLMRYRHHFENNRRFIDQRLWSHLFDSIQNGLGDLSATKSGVVPRIPLPSCLFLAKLINILSYPQNKMYAPLTNFLLLSDTFEFNKVPEFKILFHSAEVSHVNHRYYILNILKDSIKTTRDFNLLFSSHVLKYVMSFYSAIYSDKNIDLLILSTINNCVKIPVLAKVMIETVGIQSWLLNVIETVSDFKFDSISGIISILSNIWYATVVTKPNSFYRNDVENFLVISIVRLLPKLTNQLSLKCLSKVCNILARLPPNKLTVFNQNHISQIIAVSDHHFRVEDIRDLKYILKEKVKLIHLQSHLNYSRQLKSNGVEELHIFAVASLREFFINWSLLQLG